MRILKVTQAYYPYLQFGGPVVKVRAIAEHLAARGHRVTVLTADLGPRNGLTPPQGPGARVETVYLGTLARYRASTVNPGVLPFCLRRLREFDLVHIYGLYDLLGPVVAAFCRRWDIPYAVEPLGMVRPIDRSFRLKRLWHILLGGPYLRAAAQFIATSEQEYGEIVADGFPADHVLMRYNGLDLQQFVELPPQGAFRSAWNVDPGEPCVLFLGRLIPRKGADLLIEAFAKACPHRGKLVIAGPEGERGYVQSLREKASALDLGSRVIFPGPLYDDQKKAAFVDADMFVLPSLYENFANAAAEAIAFQVPVIVTNSCGISSLVDQRVGLVIPYDKQALVGAMRQLLDDRLLYARLKSECCRVASELSWEHLIEKMEHSYNQVTMKKHARQ